MTRTGKLVGRTIWIATAAAAILYGAAQAAIRSPWFRVAVERRLSMVTGMEVRVGRIRPTESLNLRISDITALEDRAGLEVKVMRVKWSFFAPRGFSRIRKLILEDAVLTMAPDAEGNLLPAVVGDRTWELVSRLAQGQLQNAPRADKKPNGEETADDGATSPEKIGVGHVRLLRGTFSLRDIGGRERFGAKDVDIDWNTGFGAAGRKVEHWEVEAAVLSAEGMQLTGMEWVADRTEDGAWNVTRFASDGWSSWAPAESPDGVERATEEYRKLLGSI